MNPNAVLENVIHYIDEKITQDISINEIASKIGYSPYHLCHLFSKATGISLIAYVTWRKLQYAVYDIAQGKKIIDVAMEYGFETHAGFTKAFKRFFGHPPSLYLLHADVTRPEKVSLETIKDLLKGENSMNPYIIELTPFAVVGYPSRHTLPNVRNITDVPAYWSTLKEDDNQLPKLYVTFPKSKHFEVCLCYDVDINQSQFTYLVGRGVDLLSELDNITDDMTCIDITGGLYAVFSTPPAAGYLQFGPALPSDGYIQTIQDTWNDVLQKWLPHSEFVLDETRHEFEYYDLRDHGCYFGGKSQMDICIPIKKRDLESR